MELLTTQANQSHVLVTAETRRSIASLLSTSSRTTHPTHAEGLDARWRYDLRSLLLQAPVYALLAVQL
ncbi:hypothetical protein BDW42DRAFT_179712 [Aspergillus taichungensis]|uniref:Uncharacterized protein n=1 Tax=Aspergillus taichungensis TaxID=482145 RepID=A0A2J5HG51_9EURO|nr:hypothetical protein BDW42DRAFT_179712 [Aspergillus taichungensis]